MKPDILIKALRDIARDHANYVDADKALEEYREELVRALDGCFCDEPECAACTEARRQLELCR